MTSNELRKKTERNAARRVMLEFVDESFRLYYRLQAVDEQMHGPGTLSGSERAALYALFASETTAPELARQRHVSRQRSQQILNVLTKAGLAVRAPNPASEKSPLYRLTSPGRKAVGAMLRKEHRTYAQMQSRVSERKLRSALDVMRSVGAEIERQLRLSRR
jgi:DNA-binding MarR family transcriptional regulator